MTTINSPVSDVFLPEFKASAIREDVVALNICILGDTSAVAEGQDLNEHLDFLIDRLKLDGGSKEDRDNPGRISTSSLNYARKMCGGWYNAPFYGLAEKAVTNYFYFKPNVPPKDYKGRLAKYRGATGVPARLMTGNVPESIWAVVACRYNVEKTGDNFWEWVLEHPEIPVIIGEGFKKGLSGISAGYPTAGINGCNGGCISLKEDDGTSQGHELIPDLKALAEGGRTIYLALDRDTSGKTKRRVHKATKILASLLAAQDCQVFSIKWDASLHKGLDDFIAGAGIDAFELAIENATDITPQPKTAKQKLPPPLEVAAVVVERLFDKLRYDASTSQWWKYDGMGKWAPTYDVSVFKLVQEYLDQTLPAFLPSYVDNVIKFARSSSIVESWQEASSLKFLPFRNGVLDLWTKELLPHSPDYGFTWQLPRDYSVRSTEWHRIHDFLNNGLAGSNPELKNIAIAYCNAVLKGRSDLQKFLYLFGSGANGKGAFMTLFRMLIGAENTHATTLKELNENRFEPSNLKGKRLLLMTDEDKRVGGVSVFKSVTGKDPIRYERKGKDSTNFLFEGMAVIAANSPTFGGDSNYAIKRRKVDFPCLVTVKEHDRRDLVPEFESELPDFTAYLLSLPDEWVTKTLRDAGSVAAVKKLNWEMTMREDSIAAFLDSQLIIDPTQSVQSAEVYSSYQIFCLQNGLKHKSQTNFSPSLIELCTISLGHKISKRKRNTGWFFEGMRLRLSSDPFSTDDEMGDKPMPRKDSDGCDGLVTGMVTGLNPCSEPRVTGVTGYLLDLEKNEKKVEEEVVVKCYPPQTNKKTVMGSNGETPVTPVTIPLEALPSNTFSGDGLKNQPVTTRHTRHRLALKAGDRVQYVGSNAQLAKQYAGELVVHEIDRDGITCVKPNAGLSSWIDPDDLQLLD